VKPVNDLVFELTSEVDEAPDPAESSSPDPPTVPGAADEVESPEDAEP
jgi:hypothetical protein